MELKEVKYNPEQLQLFEEFDWLFVEVDTAILSFEPSSADLYPFFCSAAIAGMRIFAERRFKWFIGKYPDLDPAGSIQIKIYEGKIPVGNQVSFKEFLGHQMQILFPMTMSKNGPEWIMVWHMHF